MAEGWDECPHCHATVLLMDDRLCPACRKNADDPRGATPHLRRVVLREADAPPQVCIRCGEACESTEVFESARTMGGESGLVKLVLAVTRPSFFFRHPELRGQRQSVKVLVARCAACRSGDPLTALKTDFEQRTVTFLAHRRFVERRGETG